MSSLSFQTWYIHSLSVADWILFVELIWAYGYKSKKKGFLKFSTALVTFFLSGSCILTWHYFSNFPGLICLVVFQSFLTLMGNLSLMYQSRSYI